MTKTIRIILLTAVMIFFSGTVFAGTAGNENGRQNMLSPQISISQPLFQQSIADSLEDFGRAIYELHMGYDHSGLLDENGNLGMQGKVFVEMAMLAHQLGNDIMPASEAMISLVDRDELQAAQTKDIDTLKMTAAALADVNGCMVEMLEQGEVPKAGDVIDFISRARKLKQIIPELLEIKKSRRLGPQLGFILEKALSCIDSVSRRTEVMLFGVKEEKFKLADCFRNELNWQAVNESIKDIAPVFGYKGGLEFVVRNMRYNVIDHSGKTVQKDYARVRVDSGNLVMVFADNGRGFDVEALRQKAVELGFWSQKKAEAASEQEVINLIFEKGFSRRYEKGKTHGLGLWLCRQIISRYYNGDITAANAEHGQGAVFTVTIPLDRHRDKDIKDDPGSMLVNVYGKDISVNEKAMRSVRFARAEDATAIALLSERLYRDKVLKEQDVLTKTKIESLLKFPESYIFLVLETEGEVVGFCYDSIFGHQAHTNQLVIDKGHEGNGYAKALYAASLMELESRGADYIETRLVNHKMRNLVKKLGLFVSKGEFLYVLDNTAFKVTFREMWEDVLDRAKQKVTVLKNQTYGEQPSMAELPIVKANDLPGYMSRQLVASFDRWFTYQGEFDIGHPVQISDYRASLEWGGKLPDQLYFVLSDTGKGHIEIEAFIELEIVNEDKGWVSTNMETAPWNRASETFLKKYSGIGPELRSFGYRQVLKDDPLIEKTVSYNKIRVLANRDNGPDIFDETITLDMVHEYLRQQIKIRQEMIAKYAIMPIFLSDTESKFQQAI